MTIRLIDVRTGATLATKQVPAGEDGQAVRVELPYTPPAKGEFDYKLEAEPLPNESNETDNAENLLVGTGTTDLVAFVGAPVVLGATTMLASYLPARRASHANPVTALRAE